MKLLTNIQWKYLLLAVILLYTLLWLLDPGKAKRILWGAVSVMDSLMTQLFSPSSPSTFQFDHFLLTHLTQKSDGEKIVNTPTTGNAVKLSSLLPPFTKGD